MNLYSMYQMLMLISGSLFLCVGIYMGFNKPIVEEKEITEHKARMVVWYMKNNGDRVDEEFEFDINKPKIFNFHNDLSLRAIGIDITKAHQ